MWAVLSSMFSVAADAFRRRRDLEAELLALRHQLLVLNRKRGRRRVQLRPADRIFWVALSRLWSGWRKPVIVVKPETVISWHRRKDTDVLLTFYDFRAEHWKHLRTSNVIESPFATVRLRQRVTKGAGSRTKGLLMAYKLLDVAQARRRRLDGVVSPDVVEIW